MRPFIYFLYILVEICYYHICKLHCIRPYLDSSTACTIATSIVHSKLDYCNSLYYKLPKSQLSHLQQIQNSVARTVVEAPNSYHITPILHSLNWLRIPKCIKYISSDLSTTFSQLPNLHTFITSSPFNLRPCSTHSQQTTTTRVPNVDVSN